MSDTAFSGNEFGGLTAEDLPFGAPIPEGMPLSGSIEFVYEPIPPGLGEMSPGPVLAAFLSSIDVTKVSGFDQVVVLRAYDRQASHDAARRYEVMAAVNTTMLTFDGYPNDPQDAGEAASAEIRAALHLTRYAADGEMQFALSLESRLPRLLDMLVSGVVDVKRARVIERATVHLSDVAAQAVVDEVADEAPVLTTGELRARVATLCVAVDPDDAETRYETAVAERRVVVEASGSGTANLYALDLAPDDAAMIRARLHTSAIDLHGAEGETRTMDQLRADVFVDYLSGISRNGGEGAHVDVTLTMGTLTGLTNDPGDLNGFGPVIADVARRIASDDDAKLRVIVCDDGTGTPIHIVTPSRRPTASQRRRIEVRDPRCVFPGCRMPSRRCDIDHTIAVADGGRTCDCNQAPLCRHDHCIKHQHGWTYHKQPDGAWQWTTKFGHTHTTTPTRAPP